MYGEPNFSREHAINACLLKKFDKISIVEVYALFSLTFQRGSFIVGHPKIEYRTSIVWWMEY